jgi:hypothetical protein
VLGFEQSADEGNGIYVGEIEVNHQYDKSSVYLQRTREYIQMFLDPRLKAESALDKLSELEVYHCTIRYILWSSMRI